MKREVGQTKDTGFQFGIRRTFPVSQEVAWDFLFSGRGIEIWLGILEEDLEVKKQFCTTNGISGFVRVLTPYSHIRLNWKKSNWDNLSTLQIRVLDAHHNTTISIHQEKLLNALQRLEMKAYWNEVMKKLEIALKAFQQ